MTLKIQDFDYQLPAALIAQTPADAREDARLLVVGPDDDSLFDQQFTDLEHYCEAGDLLIVNNTRVVPARLHCQRASGGKVEVMLERFISDSGFLSLARSNKPLKPGQTLQLGGETVLEYIQRVGVFFQFEIARSSTHKGVELFNYHGQIPLPPYIKRPPEQQDKARYQTVYAQAEGAVAAPTAGLHFNQSMLQRLEQKGVLRAEITLHVGAGTFQPVKVEEINQHKMHQEWVHVSDDVVSQVNQAKAAGKRVIAVGTTTVRALESAALGGELRSFNGPTDIFIYPGFHFKVADVLLTNFHLPKSTLLMMISAFSGLERVRAAYAHAIAKQYRFFSYGDAMLLTRQP